MNNKQSSGQKKQDQNSRKIQNEDEMRAFTRLYLTPENGEITRQEYEKTLLEFQLEHVVEGDKSTHVVAGGSICGFLDDKGGLPVYNLYKNQWIDQLKEEKYQSKYRKYPRSLESETGLITLARTMNYVPLAYPEIVNENEMQDLTRRFRAQKDPEKGAISRSTYEQALLHYYLKHKIPSIHGNTKFHISSASWIVKFLSDKGGLPAYDRHQDKWHEVLKSHGTRHSYRSALEGSDGLITYARSLGYVPPAPTQQVAWGMGSWDDGSMYNLATASSRASSIHKKSTENQHDPEIQDEVGMRAFTQRYLAQENRENGQITRLEYEKKLLEFHRQYVALHDKITHSAAGNSIKKFLNDKGGISAYNLYKNDWINTLHEGRMRKKYPSRLESDTGFITFARKMNYVPLAYPEIVNENEMEDLTRRFRAQKDPEKGAISRSTYEQALLRYYFDYKVPSSRKTEFQRSSALLIQKFLSDKKGLPAYDSYRDEWDKVLKSHGGRHSYRSALEGSDGLITYARSLGYVPCPTQQIEQEPLANPGVFPAGVESWPDGFMISSQTQGTPYQSGYQMDNPETASTILSSAYSATTYVGSQATSFAPLKRPADAVDKEKLQTLFTSVNRHLESMRSQLRLTPSNCEVRVEVALQDRSPTLYFYDKNTELPYTHPYGGSLAYNELGLRHLKNRFQLPQDYSVSDFGQPAKRTPVGSQVSQGSLQAKDSVSNTGSLGSESQNDFWINEHNARYAELRGNSAYKKVTDAGLYQIASFNSHTYVSAYSPLYNLDFPDVEAYAHYTVNTALSESDIRRLNDVFTARNRIPEAQRPWGDALLASLIEGPISERRGQLSNQQAAESQQPRSGENISQNGIDPRLTAHNTRPNTLSGHSAMPDPGSFPAGYTTYFAAPTPSRSRIPESHRLEYTASNPPAAEQGTKEGRKRRASFNYPHPIWKDELVHVDRDGYETPYQEGNPQHEKAPLDSNYKPHGSGRTR